MENSEILEFDAVVVGGGHAGSEAVFALSKLVNTVALVTLNKNRLASMPCNPAIGGSAKGVITREIDALGGMQGEFSDKAMIQIKMLHENKGPAIHSIRAQIDKEKYSKIVLESMNQLKNVTIFEDLVIDFEIVANKVNSVTLESQKILKTKALVITTGTYLNSRTLRGNDIQISGPDGERTSTYISKKLETLGFKLLRLKTGTPPRIWADSIDFSKVKKEELEPSSLRFSHKSQQKPKQQIECFLTYTTPRTHKIILENLESSSLYSGLIEGVGPRYCPSIEDKVIRFKDKERHQIFFEPETEKCDIYYINGLSTSMPIEIQAKMVASIPGLENAKVQKWGYAIEYDGVCPFSLFSTLETKKIRGLFLAGQINGTSGYEEAAAQGLIAGINAARFINNQKPLILKRNEAYIGVMIDDLVTKGVSEPYRMLTSRAEFRLLLRDDNVDRRLHKRGFEAGLIEEQIFLNTKEKYKQIDQKIKDLDQEIVTANSPLGQKYNLKRNISKKQLLLRPEVQAEEIIPNYQFQKELIIQLRLNGYIEKQNKVAQKMEKMEKLKIPLNINYDLIHNLASEAREKLKRIAPQTIGQASRIDGVTPSDIYMLMLFLNARFHNGKQQNNRTRVNTYQQT